MIRKTYILCRLLTLLLLVLPGMVAWGQAPAGYYDAIETAEGPDLRMALRDIIKDHTRRSYNSLWTYFWDTDRRDGDKVWDIYTHIPPPGSPVFEFVFFEDQQTGGGGQEGDFYNREHSFPTSWWGGGSSAADTMYTDLHHIYPTDSWVNSLRNNWPFGEVTHPSRTTSNGGKLGPNAYIYPGEMYTGTVFEPIDEFKGDLARTYFYMATRYAHRVADWAVYADMIEDGDLAPWAFDMLYKWHLQDPVSQKEIDRNHAVYDIQGNRNPFIDHPEFVEQIWLTDVEPAAEPAQHVADFSASSIRLSWTDSGGITPPDGYLVRMSNVGFEAIETPQDGVEVADNGSDKNVPFGRQSVAFGMLSPQTTYYFKLFPYRGSGAQIRYKTGGGIQQISLEAH